MAAIYGLEGAVDVALASFTTASTDITSKVVSARRPRLGGPGADRVMAVAPAMALDQRSAWQPAFDRSRKARLHSARPRAARACSTLERAAIATRAHAAPDDRPRVV